VAKVVDQLRQLRADLLQLIERDPEQEVTGQALPLIDAVVSEAREALPPESTLASQIVEIISVDTIEAGEPLRAADALVVVGQLLAVLDDGTDEELRDADRRLLSEFRALLPSATGMLPFLRDYDLGGAFRWEILDPLGEFSQSWDNAEHHFHDLSVEAERALLLEKSSAFLQRLALESGPEGGGWQAIVPVEHRDTFRIDGRGADIRRVDELNAMATEVYEQHQRLLDVARRKLAV
jgi:hypothetical protein